MFYFYQGQRNHFPLPRGYLTEKAEQIMLPTEWGRWFQSLYDINIEINLPPETVKKDLNITIKPTKVNVQLKTKGSKITLLKGKLHGKVKVNNCSWTFIQDRNIVRVVLSKVITCVKDNTWEALFENDYKMDAETITTVRNRIDLERFQLEECFY